MTMIFIEGLSNYQGCKFPELAEVTSEAKREDIYIAKVQKLVCGSILGSYGNEAQWSLPVEKQRNAEDGGRKIGTINMENYKVRKVIESIDSLIDISIPDEDIKQELKKSIGHYKSLMLILRKKGENYTEEEFKKFQEHSLIFFQTWIILYGRHGITNYIHMIGVGHMLGYMKKYENLNKYSQQG